MRTAAYRACRLVGAFLLLGGIVGKFWLALDGTRALVLGLSAARWSTASFWACASAGGTALTPA